MIHPIFSPLFFVDKRESIGYYSFMKLRLLILASLSVILLSSMISEGKQSRKPLPPIHIYIAPVQSSITPAEIKPGQVIDFKVTAVSFMDGPEMRIDVKLTGGAKLVSGETSWTGAAAKNEEKTVILTVQAPEKGKGRIRARVSLPPSDGTRFSAEAQYILGAQLKSKPEQERPVKKDSEGRNIIEYR
jgi:hypothetical protein